MNATTQAAKLTVHANAAAIVVTDRALVTATVSATVTVAVTITAAVVVIAIAAIPAIANILAAQIRQAPLHSHSHLPTTAVVVQRTIISTVRRKHWTHP